MPMPCVGTHSGLGLMLAMEIVADKQTKAMFDPPVGPIMPLLDEARDLGLHLRQMGSNRIVIAPPCTTTIAEADRIVDILKPLVAAISATRRDGKGVTGRPASLKASAVGFTHPVTTDLYVRGRGHGLPTT